LPDELERDIDDHVLLPADVAKLADSLEDLVRRYPIPFRRALGMKQEAAVHAGPALHDRGPVHLRPAGQERADDFLCSCQDCADVHASPHTQMVEGGG
jgi:hypothetical protein